MPKIIIQGRLDGLNSYTNDNRYNKFKGNTSKIDAQKIVLQALQEQTIEPISKYPIGLKTTWYEDSMRRDADNVVFAKKFILDAFVNYGLIKNDSRKYVRSFIDDVVLDKENPRIEIEIFYIDNV